MNDATDGSSLAFGEEESLTWLVYAPTVIPPCPSWCSEPPGHEYDGVIDIRVNRAFARTHTSALPDQMAWLEQFEMNRDGVLELHPLNIAANYELGRTMLDSAQARKLAVDLVAAAVLLDSVTQATS
jgi:hypothetical protein